MGKLRSFLLFCLLALIVFAAIISYAHAVGVRADGDGTVCEVVQTSIDFDVWMFETSESLRSTDRKRKFSCEADLILCRYNRFISSNFGIRQSSLYRRPVFFLEQRRRFVLYQFFICPVTSEVFSCYTVPYFKSRWQKELSSTRLIV